MVNVSAPADTSNSSIPTTSLNAENALHNVNNVQVSTLVLIVMLPATESVPMMKMDVKLVYVNQDSPPLRTEPVSKMDAALILTVKTVTQPKELKSVFNVLPQPTES